jgi:hypothetical protein
MCLLATAMMAYRPTSPSLDPNARASFRAMCDKLERERERVKAWYAANKQRARTRQNEYYASNKTCIRKQRKDYYEANRHWIQQRDKAHAKANRQKWYRLPTKAMAAKVQRWAWPEDVDEHELPERLQEDTPCL